MKKVIEASKAIAEAAKLCKPDVIPVYPITPQTHIAEYLAEFIANGDLSSELIRVESEHSAMSASVGASATGSRVFTASASQGLALMHEILFIASGMRLPIVMVVANRALSAPINIWNDEQDSISARDSGWIQLYAESSQEAFDSVIQAFKIAENKDILLPVMVCIDGFSLSHVFEPVNLPKQNKVKQFLPKYKPINQLDPKKPMTFGPIAYPDSFIHFKAQQQAAMTKALAVIKNINSRFKRQFGRAYGNGLVDLYKMAGAKYAIIAMGSVCGTIRYTVDELRKKGKKIGLIKVRAFRPFPAAEIKRVCKKLKGVAVVDKNISFGSQGALYTEIKAIMQKEKIKVSSYIAGLGGKDIRPEDIHHIAKEIMLNKEKVEWLLK